MTILSFIRIQKLYDIFAPSPDEGELDEAKNADAFAELVQCLDDRSLSLIIREAKDDGRKALKVLREHYQGNGKPRVIAVLHGINIAAKRGKREYNRLYYKSRNCCNSSQDRRGSNK